MVGNIFAKDSMSVGHKFLITKVVGMKNNAHLLENELTALALKDAADCFFCQLQLEIQCKQRMRADP